MARAPFNVLVFSYRSVNEDFEYLLLRRSDAGYWHTVCGGGENEETPLETARRETYEEIGLSSETLFLSLSTVMPVRVTAYKDSYLWGEDVYVIPQYSFGVLTGNESIVLSDEHAEYQWLNYEEAYRLVEYEGSKIALWELNRRLRGLGPRD